MSTQRETMLGPGDSFTGYTVINSTTQVGIDDVSEREFREWMRLFREDGSDRRGVFVYPDGRERVID